MEPEDIQVQQFREQVRELKEVYWTQLLSHFPGQDPLLLNTYFDQLEKLYEILRPVLEGKKLISDIENPNVADIFKTIITADTPHYILSTCLYYSRRDLLMFPLTRDTSRINSLPDRNSLENVEFLSNK